MGRWEWILVPTFIGAATGLVLSNIRCLNIGSRFFRFTPPRIQSTLGGFLMGMLIGVIIGVLSGPGGGKRWLNGLGTGGTVGLLSGWLEDEEGGGPPWYLGLIGGGLIGCLLRLLVYWVQNFLLAAST